MSQSAVSQSAVGQPAVGQPAVGQPAVSHSAVSHSAAVGPIVLVGLMATGKTTVSRLLADRLGRRVWDSDAMIEARTGHTVAELWESGGEPAYRLLETEVLDEALDASPPGVIAAAGGVVLSGVNRARLRAASERGAVVVWLRADPAVLASRVHPGDHRPLLRDDPAGTLQQMARDREGLYAEVADRTVDVGALPINEAVEAVAAAVAGVAGAGAVGAAAAARSEVSR